MRSDAEPFSSGMRALQGGDFAAAEAAFNAVLASHPADHRAWHALAWTYLQTGRTQLGLDAARRAYESNRQAVDYLNTLGIAYGEAGELELAAANFRKALKKKPVYVDAIVNLAKTLEKQEHFDEAVRFYERALALQAGHPKLALNLAHLYCARGDAPRARALLEREARDIDAEDLAIALAQCDFELGATQRSLERLSAAVDAHPDWVVARHALAHALLAQGRWRDGWQHYRARRALFGEAADVAPSLPARLDGERILLRGEQGLGDVLFFLRFAALLSSRGARLALACEAKLHGVLEGISLDAAGPFDRQIWLGELPALLGCEDTPAAWPLALSSEAKQAARERLARLGPPPYLAVTWRAGTDTTRGREFGVERVALAKAVPPATLGAALRGWPGTVIALQRNPRPEDAAQFAAGLQASVADLSALGDDLPALLAVLSELNEYVTVSNTNVHLLAGLGRSARVLVPYPAEWRWMRHEGSSPWFPAFTVYRQPQSRDWSDVLLKLRRDLGL